MSFIALRPDQRRTTIAQLWHMETGPVRDDGTFQVEFYADKKVVRITFHVSWLPILSSMTRHVLADLKKKVACIESQMGMQ